MRAVSLFSGAGGLDLGLHRAGVEPVLLCEIDPHARKVLAARFPHVPIHDDVTTLDPEEHDLGTVDLVHGGSPCQDLSVAGRRGGLAGERSGLFWHLPRVAAAVDARWVLWENVAGALTSNGGRDFAAVLWGFTGVWPDVPEDGWRSVGVCVGPERVAVWRLLDARWFGVAQRRRRVFVVVGPRALARRVVEVLLEPESCPRGARPGAAEGKVAAADAGPGVADGGIAEYADALLTPTGGVCLPDAQAWHIVPQTTGAITAALDNGGSCQVENGMLVAFDSTFGDNSGTVVRRLTPPIKVGSGIGIPSLPAVAYVKRKRAQTDQDDESWESGIPAPTLNAMDNTGDTRATVLITEDTDGRSRDGSRQGGMGVAGRHPGEHRRRAGGGDSGGDRRSAGHDVPDDAGDGRLGTVVRRLTPLECERLMGWPDGWTAPASADSHRYRLCGNGVVAPVAEWIGRRLVEAWQASA